MKFLSSLNAALLHLCFGVFLYRKWRKRLALKRRHDLTNSISVVNVLLVEMKDNVSEVIYNFSSLRPFS